MSGRNKPSRRKKTKESESTLRVKGFKGTEFLYKGPSKHVEFIAILFILGIVNIAWEFVVGFPYSFPALVSCLMIIAVVAVLLKCTKYK